MSTPTEKTFQDRIMPKLKRLSGTYWVKVMTAEGGTPDILGCVGSSFVGLELKRSEKHKPTPLQEHVLQKIEKSGGYARVVHPGNWEDVYLEIKLMSKARMRNV